MNNRYKRCGRAKTCNTRGYSKASCRDWGADINAQIDKNIGVYDKSSTVGRYGFRRTNQQGEDQSEWLTEHGLCWVNSVFYVKKRGTWFNRGNITWYEIDGFISRDEDRCSIVKALKIKSNEMLSDHKIVEMKLK